MAKERAEFQSDTEFAQIVFDRTKGGWEVSFGAIDEQTVDQLLPWIRSLSFLHEEAAAYLGVKP